MVDALNRRLLSAHAEGRRIIVIVDEAQNLSAEVLEQVRLLTNLETATQKLLQIILIGQPELRELLDRTDLRQLAQRITGRYHLKPLSREETQGYIRHRLRVAGAAGEIFTAGALREVHRLSSGIPRVINVCCDRALLGAYTRETRKVTPALVRRAAGEVYGRRFSPLWLGWAAGAIVLLASPPAVFAGLARLAAPISPRCAAAVKTAATRAVRRAPCRSAAARAGAARAAGFDQRRAGRQQREYQRCRGISPAVVALGNGDGRTTRDPCGQAQKAGLACLDQRGSWAQVRALNRPAILTLTDDQGQRHRVVLSGLDDQFATLDLGEHNVRVPLG